MAWLVFTVAGVMTFLVFPALLYLAARIFRIAGVTVRRVWVTQMVLQVISVLAVIQDLLLSSVPPVPMVLIALAELAVTILLVRRCLRTTYWRAGGCYVLAALLIVAAALGMKAVAVEAFLVPTGGMSPVILAGDRILVDKVTLRFRPPRRGEVAIFWKPEAADASRHLLAEKGQPAKEIYVKRIVAVGGDRVELKADGLYVNGARAAGPIPDRPALNYADVMPKYPIVIPPGQLFMAGDNSDRSWDSRVWGPISADAVIGLAGVVYASREIPEPQPLQPPAPPGRIRWERIGTIVR